MSQFRKVGKLGSAPINRGQEGISLSSIYVWQTQEFSSKKGLEYCPGLTPKMIADLKSTLLYPVRQAQHMAPPKNMPLPLGTKENLPGSLRYTIVMTWYYSISGCPS